MADNVATQSGTLATIPASTTISTDDAGASGHVQRVKLAVSADGSATHIGATADGMYVQGPAADGAAVAGNPLLLGAVDGSGNIQRLAITSADELIVSAQGNLIDSNNSSTATLGIGATFTGTGTDVSQYSSVTVQVFADEASAANGMSLEWSTDDTNWDVKYQYTITAGQSEQYVMPRAAQYFRVVYTNGGTGQTAFRLETILNSSPMQTASELNNALSGEDLASTVRSVIAAETPGGAYVNIGATTGGSLKMDVEEIAGVTPSLNAGAVDAGTQRVTIATDDVVSIDDNSGSLTIDNSTLAVTGGGTEATALRVTLANDSTGVITVDGTVTADAGTGPWPVTDNAGSLTVDAPVGTPVNVQIGDGTDTALVSAAGALSVDGSGVTQPVSGTVTADAGTGPWPVTDNGGSLTVDTVADATDGSAHGASQTGFRAMGTDGTNDQQIAVDASGNVQVDIVADAAGLATAANQLPDGHNVTIDNASGASAVNIQDGGNSITVDGTVTASNTAGDVAHDTADSGNPVKVGGVAYNTDGTPPGTAVTEGDRAEFATDVYGRQLVSDVHPDWFNANENASVAQTDNELVAAPGAGLRLYITDIIMSTDTAMNIKLVRNTAASADIAGPYYFAANGGLALSFKTPIVVTANQNIGFTSSAAGNHSITVNGYVAP